MVPLVCLILIPIRQGALTKYFRSYRGNDPIGLELAGALKNVYAIASGMAEGLGYENNTRASLVIHDFLAIRSSVLTTKNLDNSRFNYPRIVRNDSDWCSIWG